MRLFFILGLFVSVVPFNALASELEQPKPTLEVEEVVWNEDVGVDKFWSDYATSKGGLTWGESTSYPEYEKVKEGDTLLIQLKQGPCLMEFFHSRWRRANDVKRWDDSINKYGGCPYIFE